MNNKELQTMRNLEASLKFARRASILMKTPQCKELFRLMMDDMGKYNNDIVRTPLSREDYLVTYGRLDGLRSFVNKIRREAERKDEYAERLERLR